jgi:hypothetical protein
VGRACGAHGRGEKRVQGFGGKARKKDHLKDHSLDGRVGSKLTLGRLVGGGGGEVDSPGSGQGSLAGSCECGDGPSCSDAKELECH